MTATVVQVFSNRDIVSATQIVTYVGTRSRSTRDNTWKTTIRHVTTYVWKTAAEAGYFFNQGSTIVPSLSVNPVYTTSDTTATAWYNLIDPPGFASDGIFNRVKNNALASGASVTLYSRTGPGPNSTTIGPISISATKSANGASLTLTAAFVKSDPWEINVYPTVEFFLNYSTDASGGTQAPLPIVQNKEPLTAAGNASIILTADPISNLSFRSTTNKSFTVTLNNVGTFECTLTDVSLVKYQTNCDLSIVSVDNFPVDVPAGGSEAFTVTLTGTIQSVWDVALRIRSNSFTGDVIAPFTTTVISRPFLPTANPASLTKSLGRMTDEYQPILLSTNGTGMFGSVTATFISGSPGFSVSVSGITGPNFVNSPEVPETVQSKFTPPSKTGTYGDTLRITINPLDTTQDSVVIDVPITYTMSIGADQNLGSWLSAGNGTNGVVGFSYDLLGGVPTLTIGYGGGGDSQPQVNNGGYSQLSVANLGVNGDISSPPGIPVYPYTNSAYGPFLNLYGVWITPGGGSNFGAAAGLIYTVTLPKSGRYRIDAQADSKIELYIDDNDSIKVSSENNPSGAPSNATFFLTAGQHTIRIQAFNADGPAAFAATINPEFEAYVWTTRDLCRPSPAYRNWAEVYRIPLTLGAYKYYSGAYKVKSTDQAWGLCYGDYYDTSSMFTVTDNGLGDLSIQFLPEPAFLSQNDSVNLTMFYARYLAYYYSEAEGTYRFNNLEAKSADGATTFFLGFNRLGNVITSRVTIPTFVNWQTARPSSGGGNDNWKFIRDAYTFYNIVTGATYLNTLVLLTAGSTLVTAGSLTAALTVAAAYAEVSVVGAIAEVILIFLKCFIGSSLVTMADGSTKRIDQVVVGDRVFNWNKTQINTVEFLEILPATTVDPIKIFYSPDREIEPFATFDHPLYVDGQLVSADPDLTFERYPWLGRLDQMKFIRTAIIEDVQQVYNLWVNNDHTYIVNGFGTTSIIQDAATPIQLGYKHGYIKTHEEAMEYFDRHSTNGRDLRVGSYLFWSWLTRLTPEIVQKFFVKIFCNLSLSNQDRINNFVMKPLGYSANSLFYKLKEK